MQFSARSTPVMLPRSKAKHNTLEWMNICVALLNQMGTISSYQDFVALYACDILKSNQSLQIYNKLNSIRSKRNSNEKIEMYDRGDCLLISSL